MTRPGGELAVSVEDWEYIIVPPKDAAKVIHKVASSSLLGAGRGRDAVFGAIKERYIGGITRRLVGRVLKRQEFKNRSIT